MPGRRARPRACRGPRTAAPTLHHQTPGRHRFSETRRPSERSRPSSSHKSPIALGHELADLLPVPAVGEQYPETRTGGSRNEVRWPRDDRAKRSSQSVRRTRVAGRLAGPVVGRHEQAEGSAADVERMCRRSCVASDSSTRTVTSGSSRQSVTMGRKEVAGEHGRAVSASCWWLGSGYFTSSASCTSGHLMMPSAGSTICGPGLRSGHVGGGLVAGES